MSGNAKSQSERTEVNYQENIELCPAIVKYSAVGNIAERREQVVFKNSRHSCSISK